MTDTTTAPPTTTTTTTTSAAIDQALQSLTDNTNTTNTNNTVLVEDRILKWGSMFGVLALATSQPYFKTAIATGVYYYVCIIYIVVYILVVNSMYNVYIEVLYIFILYTV